MRKTIGKLFLILMLLVIYAPILILAVYSFTDFRKYRFDPRIFYAELCDTVHKG